MLSFEINGTLRVTNMLQKVGRGGAAAVKLVVKTLGVELQALVKNKLSDDVLHVRSGTLRRSIGLKIIVTTGTISAIVGTNLIYARIHEYGGKIPAHRIFARGKALAWLSGSFTPKAGQWSVKKGRLNKSGMKAANKLGLVAFAKWVDFPGATMPQRSFLGSSLKEMRPDIVRRIDAAIKSSLKEAQK